jgi:CBS domain-containing protein
MRIREVMTTDVELTNPDASLKEAAMAMRDGDFGALPVGENDRLVGMLTDRDMTVRAVAEGTDPNSTTVRDAMSQGIDYCFDDDPVEDAAKLMSSKQIRRLPVLNHDKRLVGIVALRDLAVESSSIRPAAETLSDVSKD